MRWTDILVFQVLQQLQFSVCALGEDWSTEGLHNLLNGHVLVRELISGRASRRGQKQLGSRRHVGGSVGGKGQQH